MSAGRRHAERFRASPSGAIDRLGSPSGIGGSGDLCTRSLQAARRIRWSVFRRCLPAGCRDAATVGRHEPLTASPRKAAACTDQLLQRLAELQFRLAAPEHLLIRRFFQASHLENILGMLRDLNLAAVEQVHADEIRGIHEQQTQLLESSEQNVGELVTLQQNIEWVEVGIVFVYANELVHTLGSGPGDQPRVPGDRLPGVLLRGGVGIALRLESLETAWPRT